MLPVTSEEALELTDDRNSLPIQYIDVYNGLITIFNNYDRNLRLIIIILLSSITSSLPKCFPEHCIKVLKLSLTYYILQKLYHQYQQFLKTSSIQ